MPNVALSLPLTPVELLRRVPRRAGTFLLDGGGAGSWGSGEALLGWEPGPVLALGADAARARSDPFALIEEQSSSDRCAGVVCALGYDLGRWIEPRLGPVRAESSVPLLFAAPHPWILAYSYRSRRYELRAPHLNSRELEGVAERVHGIAAREAPPARCRDGGPVASDVSREQYLAAVDRVLEYIAAGDVYQVNLAQRFLAAQTVPPAALFARMLACHPAPYSAFVDGGAWAVASNSPECLLRLRGETVSTFPIKGTRARGASESDDKAMASALLSSVKDAAEHLMIVDLERNDLGRVCRYGSVHVPSYRRLRSFPSLHHLESEVAGELRPQTPLAALLRAVFPGGSITGAPKLRAMQIIDELEPVGRGLYTGAIGFVSESWSCFNIAIRTATIADGVVSYHAGGGIVADSDPASEYEETLLKSRAFFAALQTREHP